MKRASVVDAQVNYKNEHNYALCDTRQQDKCNDQRYACNEQY